MNFLKKKISALIKIFVKHQRKLYYSIGILGFIILLLTTWANYNIINASKSFVTDNMDELPSMDVGLLLGTSKFLSNNQPNDFFYNRIDAAVQLYKAGKIKYIIVSGDNSEIYYNEPIQMKKALIKAGIPDSVIYLDYAGFRTFDSVVRAREVFGQTSFIVISQKFHNERAVYIARRLDMNVYGFNAKDVSKYMGMRTNIREYFARLKVYIDFIFGVKPHFLGDKIKIG